EDVVEVIPASGEMTQSRLSTSLRWRSMAKHQTALIHDAAHAGDETDLALPPLDSLDMEQTDPPWPRRRCGVRLSNEGVLADGEPDAEQGIEGALGSEEDHHDRHGGAEERCPEEHATRATGSGPGHPLEQRRADQGCAGSRENQKDFQVVDPGVAHEVD